MNATIELERDRRHRLRWWTLAVLSVSLLWPREGVRCSADDRQG